MTNVLNPPVHSPSIEEEIESIKTAEPLSLGRVPWSPAYDVFVSRNRVTMRFDLPGVPSGNLHVACMDRCLHVWGHRSAPLGAAGNRPHGPFSVEVGVPEWVDVGRADHHLDSGVLTVSFPRRRESLKREKVSR